MFSTKKIFYTAESNLIAWGSNFHGQFANAQTNPNPVSPQQSHRIPGKWKNVQLNETVLAIKEDDSLWAWGNNNTGKIGNNTLNNSTTSKKIMNDVSKISVGQWSIAIKKDSTLWQWGIMQPPATSTQPINPLENPDSLIPKNITGSWKDAQVGFGALAIKTNGSLLAWGSNQYGQLGNGTTSNTSQAIPTEIPGIWKSISISSLGSAFAIKNDDTLWAWGYNQYAQLGDGTTINKTTPTQIGSNTWKHVSAGDTHTLAIKSDNTLWIWGTLELGSIPITTPTKVNNSSWLTATAGNKTSYAIKSDNTLWAWGNVYESTQENYNPNPTQILSQIKFKGITENNRCILALIM